MFDATTGELRGGIGLTSPSHAYYMIEMGYWLGSSFTGQGLCTEAGQAVLGFAFGALECHRVRIRCAVDNHASLAVIQRLGARLEGRFVRAHHYEGLGWIDLLEFALLAEEWDVEAGQRKSP